MSFFENLTKKWKEKRNSLLPSTKITPSNRRNSSLDEESFCKIEPDHSRDLKLPIVTPLEPVTGQHPLANSTENIAPVIRSQLYPKNMGNNSSAENTSPVTLKSQANINEGSTNSVSTSRSPSTSSLIATPVSSDEKSVSTVSSPKSPITQESKLGSKDTTRWRSVFGDKGPRSVAGSFTCPVCSVILYTSDDGAVSQHVDGCLTTALNKTNMTSTSSTSSPTKNPPPTSNRTQSQTISIANVQSPSTFQTKPMSPAPLANTVSSPVLSSSFTPITTLSPPKTAERFKDQPPLFPEQEIDESDPFAIRCPYPSCTKLLEAKDFYDHVMALHSAAPSQSHSCPVCTIMGVNNFKPNKDTNLYRHVRSNHYDLSQANSRSTSTSSSRGSNRSHSVSNVKSGSSSIRSSTGSSGTTNSPSSSTSSPISSSPKISKEDLPADVLNMYKNLGSRYVVDTLKQAMDTECTICYEEFEEGAVIARLDCFCIFHKKCIDQWFKKSNKCPLHKDEFL